MPILDAGHASASVARTLHRDAIGSVDAALTLVLPRSSPSRSVTLGPLLDRARRGQGPYITGQTQVRTASGRWITSRNKPHMVTGSSACQTFLP